jgi:hypothetical protein
MRYRASKLFPLGSFVVALFVAGPVHAQTPPEGWRFFEKGSIAVSPVMIGPMIATGDASGTAFGLFNDVDFHMTSNIAIGALLNLGFRSSYVGLDVGPQFKYKFQVGGTSHVPYVRAALPLRFGFVSGGDTGIGMGIVQFGGGYKYFFHRMVGAGMDLGFVPTVIFSPNSGFSFGVNIQFGIELKL